MTKLALYFLMKATDQARNCLEKQVSLREKS